MASPPIPAFDDFVKESSSEPESSQPVPDFKITSHPASEYPSFDEFDKKEVNHSLLKEFGTATVDQLIGANKGINSSIYGLGMLLRDYVPGIAWLGNKVSDLTLGAHVDEETYKHGRELLGLEPTNLAQKVGYYGEQLGEFLAPGGQISKGQKLAQAGTRFAEAFPKLAKLAPSIELASKGAMEAVPAMTIAKVQGQESTGGLGMMAMASPTFGSLLNKTGASGLASGAAKGVVGKISKDLAEKIPEVTQSPRQMMWRALKPYVRNRDFDKALNNGMPELYTQAKIMGKKVETVDDFLEVLKATKKRIWAPYEKFLGETKATIDGNAIAAAIRGAVAPRQIAMNTSRNAKGAEVLSAEIKKIYNWADQYKFKKMPLSQAEDYLQNVNAEIQSFYGKYPAARHAALEADVPMAAAVKEAEALRKAIGEVIEKSHPKVKQIYGALSNLEQEAYRRVNVAKRLAPESLVEQMSKVHAVGEFAWGVARGHPLEAVAALAKGQAYVKAAKIIKERNTSDYLIKKAFADFGEYVEKARKAHRIPTAVTGAAESQKSAKITEPAATENYTVSQPITSSPTPPPKFQQYQERPLYEERNLSNIEIPKTEPKDISSLDPEVKSMVEDTVRARMREAKEVYQSGIGNLSGKGKKIEDIEKMNYASAAEQKQGYGNIRVKSAIPELADFKESPGRIAEAIEKDKDNPLYLKVKKAVEEATLEDNADKIEEFNKLKILGKMGKKKKSYEDVPF
jgi:hypothetical protein